MNAEKVKQDVLGWIRYLPKPDYKTSLGERGIVAGMMTDALRMGGSVREANLRRYVVLAYLFRDYLGRDTSFISSKDLPEDCLWAIVRYCDASKTDKGWTAKEGFAEAMVSCYYEMCAWQHEMDKLCGND
jgi:hypothetical protein